MLAGLSDGYISLMQSQDRHPLVDPRVGWSLGSRPTPDVGVTCMAAVDQVVVAGYENGVMQFMKMDTPIPIP